MFRKQVNSKVFARSLETRLGRVVAEVAEVAVPFVMS